MVVVVVVVVVVVGATVVGGTVVGGTVVGAATARPTWRPTGELGATRLPPVGLWLMTRPSLASPNGTFT